MRFLPAFSALVGFALVGCAGADTVQTAPDRAAVAIEQAEQMRLAREASRAQASQHRSPGSTETPYDRLQRVAWPVLRANTALCTDRVELRTGLRYGNQWDYEKEERAAAAELFGMSNDLARTYVTQITSGSPADHAGLMVGDALVSVDGQAVPLVRRERDAKRARRDMGNLWARAKSDREVIVEVARKGEIASSTIDAVPVCSFPLVLAPDPATNAFTDGSTLYITTGMLRFAETDLELQTVISHELAHGIKGHVGKKKRNMLGFGLLGVVADALNAMSGVRTNYTELNLALGSRVHSQDFEREADYVGLYLLANAGIDTSQAAYFWRRMAVESPKSIVYAGTHPTTAERFVNLNNTTAEIETKRASGQPLLPNLKR